MRLAQRQQSNPRCLLSPQTGRVTPAGLKKGERFVPRRWGKLRQQGATDTRTREAGKPQGTLLQVTSRLERSRRPTRRPLLRALLRNHGRGRQTPTTLPNQLAGKPERIPGCRHRPGAQPWAAWQLILAAPLPPRASSAEGGPASTSWPRRFRRSGYRRRFLWRDSEQRAGPLSFDGGQKYAGIRGWEEKRPGGNQTLTSARRPRRRWQLPADAVFQLFPRRRRRWRRRRISGNGFLGKGVVVCVWGVSFAPRLPWPPHSRVSTAAKPRGRPWGGLSREDLITSWNRRPANGEEVPGPPPPPNRGTAQSRGRPTLRFFRGSEWGQAARGAPGTGPEGPEPGGGGERSSSPSPPRGEKNGHRPRRPQAPRPGPARLCGGWRGRWRPQPRPGRLPPGSSSPETRAPPPVSSPVPGATHGPSALRLPTMKPNLSTRRSSGPPPLTSESDPRELSSSPPCSARLSRVPARLWWRPPGEPGPPPPRLLAMAARPSGGAAAPPCRGHGGGHAPRPRRATPPRGGAIGLRRASRQPDARIGDGDGPPREGIGRAAGKELSVGARLRPASGDGREGAGLREAEGRGQERRRGPGPYWETGRALPARHWDRTGMALGLQGRLDTCIPGRREGRAGSALGTYWDGAPGGPASPKG